MAFRWNSLSYRTRLFLIFLLISSIPAALIGTVAYKKSADMLQSQVTEDMYVIIRQLNTAIERQINDFDRFSILPYYMPDSFEFLRKPYVPTEQWGSDELAAQKNLLRLMSAYPSINASIKGMVLYGMNGTISGYRVSGSSQMKRGSTVEDEDWYKQAVARNGGFVVSGIRSIDQFDDAPFTAVTVARMLVDEKLKPLAVMALHVSPEFIANILYRSQLEGEAVVVLDADNKPIYASDNGLASALRQVEAGDTPSPWSARVASEGGDMTYSGVSMYSSYLGWKVFLGKNREELLAGSRLIRLFTYAIVIVMAVAAALVSWLLARSLSDPVLRMIRSMREVEKGRFAPPLALERSDELGQLHLSYTRMVQRLEEMVRSIEEKERQKRHAELTALRTRVQPHFLYNTLNSIRMMAILQRAPQIAGLLQSVTKLFKANMRLNHELIPLQEEMALLKDYAELMDMRYTNTFALEWEVPEELADVGVPPMLLQPLLENAIFHGSKGLERLLHIRIGARLIDHQTVVIELADDGIGISEEALVMLEGRSSSDVSEHFGIANARERIQLRFGEEYGLAIRCVEGGGTQIVITLPCQYVQGGT
ncbi:sensor histidine kinase [Paenibacillus sp. SYP-B4298]|uniref:sensor histidine kinase n=1 Tax=Paenibacillus sp. SYP-B4298 TaxID=2996034 RepID=UPI0022DD44C1|nr:sensor histidine kinase [Paenibacillus sp. SYP-B4298]